MTGKELLLHPFINRTAIARYIYPQATDAAALLESRLCGTNGEGFDSEDEEKAVAAIGLLLRGIMHQTGDKASFNADDFFEN